MRLWREGDESVGICERCKKRVSTRFERRALQLERPRISVPDVLVAACTECDKVVAIPSQSSPKLNQARTEEMRKLEARIPKHLEDVLGLIAAEYGRTDKEFRASLLRYYLNEVSKHRGLANRVKKKALSDLALGKANGRISLRIKKSLMESAWRMAREVGIVRRSTLLAGVIVMAKEDVLDKPDSKHKKALAVIAAST